MNQYRWKIHPHPGQNRGYVPHKLLGADIINQIVWISSDPKVSVKILLYFVNRIENQTCGIVLNGFIYLEFISVVPVKTIIGSKPHKSATVLKNGNHLVIG
jgi:hypothetical protein